jgi:hypothetical protein
VSAQELPRSDGNPHCPELRRTCPEVLPKSRGLASRKKDLCPQKNGLVLGKVLQRLLLMADDFGRHFGHGFGHLLGGVLGKVLGIVLGKAAHQK